MAETSDQVTDPLKDLATGFLMDSFNLGKLTLRTVTAGTNLIVKLMTSAFEDQLNRITDEKEREETRSLIYSGVLIYALSAPIAEVSAVSLNAEKTRMTITTFLQQEYFQPDRLAETFSLVNNIGIHSQTGEVAAITDDTDPKR